MGLMVRFLSQALEPGERDAVIGDLTESGVGQIRCLQDLAGLVLRRQLALWMHPRPWIVVLFMLPLITVMLGLLIQEVSGWTAINAWFYIDNWTPGYLAQGFSHDLLTGLRTLCFQWLTLGCWAWTSGMLVGFLLRRATYSGALFFVASLLAFTLLMVQKVNWGDPNSAVFSRTVYSTVLPFAFLTALVLLPALIGMSAGMRLFEYRPSGRSIMCLGMTATMLALFVNAVQHRANVQPYCWALSLLAPLIWIPIRRYETR